MQHELTFDPYENPESVGYKGAYSIADECVGFLTLDDQFLSIAKVYGIDLNKTKHSYFDTNQEGKDISS